MTREDKNKIKSDVTIVFIVSNQFDLIAQVSIFDVRMSVEGMIS